MKLYNEFINIAKTLNKELDIIPLLYGSLGLEKVTGLDFSPEDIDILIPLIFLEEKWEKLKKIMDLQGYKMVDLHEHEFRKTNTKIGIAYIEDLKPFADVDYNNLEIFEDYGAKYHLLTIYDYLKVYNKSLLDGYRRTKKNNKDQSKINILNKLIQS
ncbi:hypothetical protein [Bacillus inaquosorum]|uniref:hypothetical protein n=1 Tax=Bacillus inaquosorum TaxID=483913 RepID=UPI000745E37B|nr:hypothetical protein [Bacillus inaquosorum]PPA37673.1 hypothetical protein C4E21_01475 [Bacillus subtilis]AMA52432.1 hypothetical protein AN935_09095 [Bacillus inaquosorum]MBT2191342.1 hypothetical protein [Bacillus inaquosorum]MBT3120254.1 hypothetical protein [Bacillus inaquosorum]MBT3121240.1 hypothetical protein [Bacillus inaquosorum]